MKGRREKVNVKMSLKKYFYIYFQIKLNKLLITLGHICNNAWRRTKTADIQLTLAVHICHIQQEL